jgi:hypothetical protein
MNAHHEFVKNEDAADAGGMKMAVVHFRPNMATPLGLPGKNI